MLYESRKKDDIIICALCRSIEDVLSRDEEKGHQVNLGGKYLLPLCDECIKHEITNPTMGFLTTFGEGSTGED